MTYISLNIDLYGSQLAIAFMAFEYETQFFFHKIYISSTNMLTFIEVKKLEGCNFNVENSQLKMIPAIN